MERPTGNGGGKCTCKCSKCYSVSAENRRLKRKMDNLKKMIDYLEGEKTRARVAELNKVREQEIKDHRWVAQHRKKHHSESGAREIEKVVDSKCESVPLFSSFTPTEGNIFTHKCRRHSSSGINKKYDDYVERAKRRKKLYKEERY